ncbi:28S ribosomal protein S5, mitochondrial isoform B [Alligator mississippiensis]|uniref:Small ribosomal subunit protein uS5m n=1 Tax=Alligator mississippiensis TaxID=8496 RepID=A0A151M1I5_ALLMI|nr:28S ribosomal protein S5, mitochondrial isoform B [Alligator mississippiensis]
MAVVGRLCVSVAWRAAWRGYISLPVNGSGCRYTNLRWALQTHCYISAPCGVTVQQSRQSSFFNKLTADELWKGVLANTSSRQKKGRGKRSKKKLRKDLNKGQIIGEGRSGILWPGLSIPVMVDGKAQVISQHKKEQREIQDEILRRRDEWEKKRKVKVKKERGWTGRSWGGISLGPPDPGPNGETYEDFDCQVLELKSVACMTGREGQKKSASALVVVGNGNGAAGFALGKAKDRLVALRKAKNQAIHYLHYIERYQDHTIYHDITTTFKKTTIQMRKKHKGYGLHCHRAIITVCKLIGITDMYAKVCGSPHMLNLTKALFKGLANQKTHQDLANEKSLHVVEFREEQGPLPILVASPQGAVRKDPETIEEVPDVKLEWNENVNAVQRLQYCKGRKTWYLQHIPSLHDQLTSHIAFPMGFRDSCKPLMKAMGIKEV